MTAVRMPVLVAGLLLGAATAAAAFPTKPVRMVIAAPAGTGPELIARQLAMQLAEAWGQPVVVDPRPGATGLIGAERSGPSGLDRIS